MDCLPKYAAPPINKPTVSFRGTALEKLVLAYSFIYVYKLFVIDRADPTPLYKQIAEVIRQRVRSGQWPRHYKLKAEDKLAAEFGVSRGTLRQALQSLVEEGLLTQVQGRGTFVSAPSGDLPLAQRLVTMYEILAASGRDFVTEVLEQKIVRGPDKIRTLLDLPEDEQLFYIHRRRLVEGEPLVVMENYVRITLCPELAKVDFTSVPLFNAIENRCGLEIGWGQRAFAATTAGTKAELLRTEASEPVLYLEQVSYLANGEPFEYSDVWVRGGKLRITTVLSRATPNQMRELKPGRSKRKAPAPD
ncbi:GntR family transcriptional regulator [Rubrobacter xylanophilus]|uniref:GntR family transcriptional regulator n=1 Tax=Rubrobacter xylanophilus TaxID=49319 RepID=UPI000055167D|nr:GntR family transcriptional regulator [Rubrobacter xylanophilus]